MFRALLCSSSGGQLYCTAAGIITPVGGHPVHRTATYRCDDTSRPVRRLREDVSQPAHRTATYRV